jgi:rhamnose utilization protein RhaD (predicted bifunctional aldolase and dehydrogenase)
MKTSITNYCAAIGADPLLVQGAGGNVSWKSGDTLWVKASGTCLADAERNDIFIPVDLPHLASALSSGDFSVIPRLRGQSPLRPSIETLLHALMPHRVVVHLHAVEILAWLVRNNYERDVGAVLGSHLRWTSTGYHKPGPALAQAVSIALDNVPDASVVLLQNHGVIIGGADIDEISHQLRTITDLLATEPRPLVRSLPYELLSIADSESYKPVIDPFIRQLAMDMTFFNRLSSSWALCPDHVVFLGARPACYSSMDGFRSEMANGGSRPELIFIRDTGVFTQPNFNAGQMAQLRCYYDVLARQPEGAEVNVLSNDQIAELLDWDAERYRIRLMQ